jgi:hypothetical protein
VEKQENRSIGYGCCRTTSASASAAYLNVPVKARNPGLMRPAVVPDDGGRGAGDSSGIVASANPPCGATLSVSGYLKVSVKARILGLALRSPVLQ